MPQQITIAVFSENKAGLLHRVTTSFTRRKINIESLTVSESEIPGIHRYTIVVEITEDEAIKLVHALEKLARVRRECFHIAALSLRVDRVERERRLAATAWPRDDVQFPQRQIEVDALQVVLPRATNLDDIGRSGVL